MFFSHFLSLILSFLSLYIAFHCRVCYAEGDDYRTARNVSPWEMYSWEPWHAGFHIPRLPGLVVIVRNRMAVIANDYQYCIPGREVTEITQREHRNEGKKVIRKYVTEKGARKKARLAISNWDKSYKNKAKCEIKSVIHSVNPNQLVYSDMWASANQTVNNLILSVRSVSQSVIIHSSVLCS